MLSRSSVEPIVRQTSAISADANINFTVVLAVDTSEASQKVVDLAIKLYQPGMFFKLINVILNPSAGELRPHQNIIATGGDPAVISNQQLDNAALELAKLDSLYGDKLTAARIPYSIDEVPVLPSLLQILGLHQGAGIGATICKYVAEQNADLVILGRVNGGPLGNAIMQHVLNNVDKPVLVA